MVFTNHPLLPAESAAYVEVLGARMAKP